LTFPSDATSAEDILTLAQRLSGRETVKKRSILGRLWK